MRSVISCRLRRLATPIGRILRLFLAAMPVTAACGCGAPNDLPDPSSSAAPAAGGSANFPAGAHGGIAAQAGKATPPSPDDGSAALERPANAGEPARPAAATARKIIYDAKIELVVESLSGLEPSLLDLVKEHGGFLADSELSSQGTAQRTATWRVRIPVDRFDAFVRGVGRLGEVRTSHLGSQDVTEQFFDLDARIRNKQEEERRLIKHLADSTGKLEDILKIEHELSRVRGEVEQMQGRLRFLANRSDLGTATISATERRIDTPPAPPPTVTLADQINTTFFGSLDVLTALGKAMLLVAVALAPWVPLIVIGLVIARLAYRSSSTATPDRTTS